MTLWSPPFIYNIAGPVNSITAGPIAFTKPVGILGVKGASAAGASLGTNVGLGVVLAPVAIVAAVLALGALYNAIRAEEIKKIRETNRARIRELDNKITALEAQADALRMKLQRDMNAASKALGSKAVDFSFQIPNLEQSIALGTLPTMPNMNGSGQSTKTYQVRKGDTLSSIAQRYDMAWEDLWNLNKGNLQSGDPNLIYPNEVLNIPSNAKVTPTVSKAVPQPNFKWSTASVNAYVYSPIATSDPSLGIRNTSPEAKLILRNQRLNNLAEQYPIQAERGRIGLPEKSNMIGQNQQGAMYFQNGAYLYEMYSKKMGTGSNYYKYNSSAKKWELYQTEDNYTNAKNQGIVQFYETWANITVGVLMENLGIAFKGEELIAKSLVGRELLRNPLSIYGQRFSEIGTPSSDKINVIGKYSNRLFNPNNAGGKILNLNWRNTKFTKDGVDAVKKHLERFRYNGKDSKGNLKMIERLELISKNKLRPSDYDKRFYTHEIREYERYKTLKIPDGYTTEEIWSNTHAAALEDYKINERIEQLYHPSIDEIEIYEY